MQRAAWTLGLIFATRVFGAGCTTIVGATHLRQGNNIGFRNDMEHALVIGGKLRFGLGQGDPAGITFHSSAQRILWLQGQRNAVDRNETEVFRQIRKREYDDCRRAGRDNCIQ